MVPEVDGSRGRRVRRARPVRSEGGKWRGSGVAARSLYHAVLRGHVLRNAFGYKSGRPGSLNEEAIHGLDRIPRRRRPRSCLGLLHRQSSGFTRLWPSVITLVTMIASFLLLSIAMRTLPLATAYTVSTGSRRRRKPRRRHRRARRAGRRPANVGRASHRLRTGADEAVEPGMRPVTSDRPRTRCIAISIGEGLAPLLPTHS